MGRFPNRHGGGARTNANGLAFEQTTSLDEALAKNSYTVSGCRVYAANGDQIGWSVPQSKVYSQFLKPNGIDYCRYNSKRWHPDECFVNLRNNTAYIIEKKFQNNSGSVDEKLPGCDFKKKEYEKLFNPLGYEVVFLYVFNDWFRQDVYRDTLEYIESVGCHYFYNTIPLEFLGL